MVDTQPVHQALVQPAADLPVGVVEDLLVLHAQAGEGGDGEESAVVQLGVGAPPRHELVVLAGVHLPRRAALGAGREGEAAVVVPQLAVLDAEGVLLVRAVAEHGQP